MKRVFIVHGWDGSPAEGWFPWLKTELKKKGFTVAVPAMPHPERPTIEDWTSELSRAVGTPDTQTYFVGHSIGCQTILRYLAMLPNVTPIGGAVFVAGWFTLKKLEDADAEAIAAPWVQGVLDTPKVKNILSGKISAIFSRTDSWVPLENEKIFQDKLGAKIYIENGGVPSGHFSGSDGIVQLPKVLELILDMSTVPTISIDEFFKSEIKMGKIISAEKIEGADKLLKLQVDLGEGKVRTICSGVAQHYQPEELVGKSVPVIANLAPRVMRGIESQGMILMASTAEGKPILLTPISDVEPGATVK